MNRFTTLLLLPLLCLGCNGPSMAEPEADKAAIQELIRRETMAYFEKDLEAWQDCYVHRDYLRHWSSWEGYPKGIRHYDSWEDLLSRKGSRFTGAANNEWTDEALEFDELNIQVRGNTAWATFRQIDHDPGSGQVLGESLATQILERHQGQWKIAYVNYLFFPRGTGI